MHLDRRESAEEEGVPDRHAGVGVPGGVDHHPVGRAPCPLERLHDLPFVVGLEELHRSAFRPRRLRDGLPDGGESLAAVETGFTLPQHVQVRPVDEKGSWGRPSASQHLPSLPRGLPEQEAALPRNGAGGGDDHEEIILRDAPHEHQRPLPGEVYLPRLPEAVLRGDPGRIPGRTGRSPRRARAGRIRPRGRATPRRSGRPRRRAPPPSPRGLSGASFNDVTKGHTRTPSSPPEEIPELRLEGILPTGGPPGQRPGVAGSCSRISSMIRFAVSRSPAPNTRPPG